MELLLFILFMLFSIVSSLLERRKRKRELENARQTEAARSQRTEFEEQQEEEVTVGLPFGGGKDPFEDEVLTRRFGDLQRLGEKEAEAESDLWMEELEVAPEPPSAASPTEQRDASDADIESLANGFGYATRRKRGWKIDAKKAREAIVYSEILGQPKALRNEER